MLKIGDKVPELTIDAFHNGKTKRYNLLKDFRGKWLVLFFYPEDFTFICPTEIKGFAGMEKDFNNLNAVILSASTDSVHSHKAWHEKELNIVKFPMLADTNHELSRLFGVLLEDKGVALRGTFVIDPKGILQYAVISNLNVGRSVQETYRVLQALQTDKLCPVEWKPGEKTLN